MYNAYTENIKMQIYVFLHLATTHPVSAPRCICGSSSKRSPFRVDLLLGKASMEPVYAEVGGNFVLRLPTKVIAATKALTRLC